MIEKIKKNNVLCGWICGGLALFLVLMQFVPFWTYSEGSYKEAGEALVVETSGGQWEFVSRELLTAENDARRTVSTPSKQLVKYVEQLEEKIDDLRTYSGSEGLSAQEKAEAIAKIMEDKIDPETNELVPLGEGVDTILEKANAYYDEMLASVLAYDEENAKSYAEGAEAIEKIKIYAEEAKNLAAGKEYVAEPIEKKKATTEFKVANHKEKSYSPIGFLWSDFRDSEFIEYLSYTCQEAVDFTSVLTPHVFILLTGLVAALINFIKRNSLIGALVAQACAISGIAAFLLSSPYMAGDALMWFLQIVASVALLIASVLKFAFAIRVKEREAVLDEMA